MNAGKVQKMNNRQQLKNKPNIITYIHAIYREERKKAAATGGISRTGVLPCGAFQLYPLENEQKQIKATYRGKSPGKWLNILKV